MELKFDIQLDLDSALDDEYGSVEEYLADQVLAEMRGSIRTAVRRAMQETTMAFQLKLAEHLRDRQDVVFQRLVDAWDSADDDFVVKTLGLDPS